MVLHFTVTFGDSCKDMFARQTQFQFQDAAFKKCHSKMTMKEVWFLSVVICHHLCTSEKI